MFKFIISMFTIASFIALALIVNMTTPSQMGPFGVLIVFLLIYVVSLGIITLALYFISFLISRMSHFFVTSKPIFLVSLRRTYYFSTIYAAVPVMIIGLQSVGSVGPYEILLVVIFVIVGTLYISRRIK